MATTPGLKRKVVETEKIRRKHFVDKLNFSHKIKPPSLLEIQQVAAAQEKHR
jgi:hypothetical protein